MRVTGGASAPHPSSSTCLLFELPTRGLETSGLKLLPPTFVGMNAGFAATGGRGLADADDFGVAPPEYLDPEAFATFSRIPSGVMSRSERAVTWTW